MRAMYVSDSLVRAADNFQLSTTVTAQRLLAARTGSGSVCAVVGEGRVIQSPRPLANLKSAVADKPTWQGLVQICSWFTVSTSGSEMAIFLMQLRVHAL
jgi:hypothetical protein